MSGVLYDRSILTLFPSSNGGSGSGLLDALAGGGSSVSGADPLPALRQAEAHSAADIARTAKQPQVARDIATFTLAVRSAKTPKALLQNPTVLKVLLTANGLGDQVQYAALAQKALLSDTSRPGALAAQLSNTAWKSTAATFQFATKGLSVLQNPSVIASVTQGYAEVLWRQSLDVTTPGLSNAIDFRNRAATIASADQVLGDPTFRAVVTTALGIPEQIAFQDLGAQEQAITTRLDLSKFASPAFVDAFTQRYLVARQASAQATQSNPNPLDSLTAQAAGLIV